MGKNQKRWIPKSIKWRIDYDYVAKLSDEEKEWMKKFNDNYYIATFDKESDWTPEEKRASYVNKNRANRDVASNLTRMGEECLPEETQELSENPPLPENTNGTEYKIWRKWFRSINDEKLKKPR